MSHPSTQGNGCSLEDCHTNLFALTDLDGIKWRKLAAENTFCLDPLDDPVLQSFTKCVQADILCVWRKVQKSGDQRPPEHLSCNKELWIFWYGDAPSTLQNLLSPELNEQDHGSWDNGGLSYECRTLLFRALHNLIERCLFQQNFVRLGMWFVQPYDGGQSPTLTDRSTHLSIRFSFFLHGESQVCASIDVRQHSPLRRLQPYHLALASHGAAQGMQVILAPYGLQGMITGQTYKENDGISQRLLDEWRQFFIMRDPDYNTFDGQLRIPPFVEVIVAGVRMRYPASFVLVTAETEAELIARNPGFVMTSGTALSGGNVSIAPLTPPSSPLNTTLGDGGLKIPVPPPDMGLVDPPMGVPNGDTLSARVVEKVWQDCCVSSAAMPHRHQQNNAEGSSNEENSSAAAVWDFAEPTQRNACNCPKGNKKCRSSGSSQQKASGQSTNKHSKDRPEKIQGRHGRNSVSFHRRSTLTDDILQHEVDLTAQRIPNMYNGFKTPTGTPAGGTGLPLLRNTNYGDTSVDSPHSAAPSPLVASTPSVNQRDSDPTMPTLSPHPPAKHGEKDLNNSMASSNGDPAESSANNSATTNNTDVFNKQPQSGIKQENLNSGYPQQNGIDVKRVPLPVPMDSLNRIFEWKGLKRPMLPTKSYEERDEELITETLYDYNSLNAWLQQPIKRQRRESRAESASSRSYHTPHHSATSGGGFSSKLRDSSPSPQQPAHDPYEFSDDPYEFPEPASSANFRAFRSVSRDDSFSKSSSFSSKQEEEGRRSPVKDEPKSLDLGGGLNPSLLREKDLVPTFNDLNKLFDTSDSESSDNDVFQAPTPPGGNKGSDEVKINAKQNSTINNSNTMDVLDHQPSVTELSRMFPTPPSLDNQHSDMSPRTNGMDPVSEQMTLDSTNVRVDIHPVLSPCEDDPNKDWSYVFKPTALTLFVGSEKYAPIKLPCHKPSVEMYKPSWQQYHQLPLIEKHHQPAPSNAYTNIPSVENSGSSSSRQNNERMTSIEASPATFPHSNQQRTPMSYELQSPASNASSYMNKNLNSVDNQGTNTQMPEVNSLVVNIMLSDSILNLFKDHNFDSCTICVCNNNIKGSDIGSYIPDKNHEPQYKCTCGFSAYTNRKYGANSGLFYEDEVDITGLRDERYEQRKPSLLAIEPAKDSSSKDVPQGEVIPYDVFILLMSQFSTMFPSSTVLHNYYKKKLSLQGHHNLISILEIQDGYEACYTALEAGRQAMDNCSSSKLDDVMLKAQCLHKWPFVQAAAGKVPVNSQDVVRLLESLQPLLQDTIQKKRTTSFWESVYTVSGPLSWKDFHLLAGRGQDEASEPQAIPPMLVGYDKDWMSLSPLAFKFWDKLLLEPYGRPRDIAYIVVAPENDFLLTHVKHFFRELSTMYELCRLGKHCPINKVRDGIMRVGKSTATKVADRQVDDWFRLIGNEPIPSKIRLYAQVCKHWLGPFLATQNLDRGLFENYTPAGNSGMRPAPKPQPEPSPAPPTPEGQSSQNQNSSDEKSESTENSQTKETSEPEHQEQENPDAPSIVVYMIDPFTYAQDWDDMNRLSTIGLLRCFQEMKSTLPEHIANNIQLQLVPLQSILDYQDTATSQYLKSLAMSVYSQCRRQVLHTIYGRSLTGFGTAAAADILLKSPNKEGRLLTTKLFSPPFVLAPQKDVQSQLAESWGERAENANSLFCGYCLSEDQRWLIAVCTDQYGEMLETCCINIEIPNRNRRKKASARKIGLSKLWDFILGVMSKTASPWRLVVGRFGRMGHGELMGWAGLLSRKNLSRASKQLRDMCQMCGFLPLQDVPCILSACLVSMEMHQSIHIMTDSVKIEEKSSSSCPLSTPRDATTTHILVFPTSATAQPNAGNSNQDQNQIDLADNFGTGLDDMEGDLFNEFSQGEGGLDISDILGVGLSPVGSPTGSPKNTSAPGSPSHGGGGRTSPTMNGPGKGGGSISDGQDEPGNLLQQPLAMGFYTSSAPTGPLPKWFWSACPHREGLCPTCLKAALHIHAPFVQQNQDDQFGQSTQRHSHPLDSSFTCDVLRYVLETYNELSWLTIDPNSNDRRSCLPVHFVVLMQLYHALSAIV